MMQKLMAERSSQLGDDFTLRQFFDDFMGGGIIPISLTRWEMTGLEDQIKKLWWLYGNFHLWIVKVKKDQEKIKKF